MKHQGRKNEAQEQIESPPEKVYAALADPSGWFIDRMTGEAKPGATVVWHFDHFGGGMDYPLEVVDAVPGKRLLLKAQVPGRPYPSLTEFTLEPKGGGTVVRVVQSGFLEDAAWDDEYEGNKSGWPNALAALKHFVLTYVGQPKKTLMAARKGEFDYAAVAPKLRNVDWLAKGGTVGDTGSRVTLALESGPTLHGRVLSRSDRHLVATWDELPGILELMVFAMGPGPRTVAIRWTGWGDGARKAPELTPLFEAAIDRLVTELRGRK